MSEKCRGIHCPGCGDGSGFGIGGAILALVAVALVVNARAAIGAAISTTLHIVEIALISIGSAFGAIILGYTTYRVVSWQKRRHALPGTSQTAFVGSPYSNHALDSESILGPIEYRNGRPTIMLPPASVKVLRDERK
ncbi:MAG TPA: hypothetical protein VH593_04570 [Ktedonobacteraceae bacterium]|jgi:hypothetical protein